MAKVMDVASKDDACGATYANKINTNYLITYNLIGNAQFS